MIRPAESRIMGRLAFFIGLLFVVTPFLPAAKAYPSIYVSSFASGCDSIPTRRNAVHGAPQADP